MGYYRGKQGDLPMKVNQGKKTATDEATAAATEDLNYRYNMLINRNIMLEFQHQCKLRNTDAATHIRAFVAKQLENWKEGK